MLEVIRPFLRAGALAAFLEFRPDEVGENVPDLLADDLRVVEAGMFRDAIVEVDVAPFGVERGKRIADAAQYHLALREQIAHFALAPAGAQGHPHRAEQSDHAKRPLQQGDVGARSEKFQHAQAHLIRPAAAGEHDHRNFRPGWLARQSLEQVG